MAVQKQKDEGLKSRLLSALLTGVNRAHPYLPEQDKDLEQHMDSLYRVVHTGPPSATTQALMLLFHVAIGSHPNDTDSNKKTQQYKMRQDRFYRALYATLALPSVVASGKHLTMYFNLLYKAMKHDDNTSRVNAMAKRLLCTTMHATPPVMAASLFLIGEIAKTREELKSCLVNVAQGESAMAVLDATKRQPEAALVHPNGESVGHAHLWETSLLANHYHPSVCKFASGNVENYSGDPLRDFSLAPFLDKFAYRNPKTNKNSNNKRGESIAERQRNNAAEAQQLPVNDPSFLEKDYVNEQDEFFQTYFAERARRDEIKGVVRNKTNADENEEEDEAFDIAENFTTGQTVSICVCGSKREKDVVGSFATAYSRFHSPRDAEFSLDKTGKRIPKRKLLSIHLLKSSLKMQLAPRWISTTRTLTWKVGMTCMPERQKVTTKMPLWTRWRI